MKRLKSIWAFAILLVVALSFSSCDKDSDIAYTLDGTWSGYMSLNHYYDGNWYDDYNAKVCFNADTYSASGDGYWQDIYSSTIRYTTRINWAVRDGKIYIDFIDNDESAVISEYSLDNDYFSGYIQYYSSYYSTGYSDRVRFRFSKIGSYNWSYYLNANAKSKNSEAMTSDSDSVKVAK